MPDTEEKCDGKSEMIILLTHFFNNNTFLFIFFFIHNFILHFKFKNTQRDPDKERTTAQIQHENYVCMKKKHKIKR